MSLFKVLALSAILGTATVGAAEESRPLESPYRVVDEPSAGEAQAEIMELFKAKKGKHWRTVLKEARSQKMITSAQFDKLTHELSRLEDKTRKTPGSKNEPSKGKSESKSELYEQLLYAFGAAVILTEQPEEQTEKSKSKLKTETQSLDELLEPELIAE